MSRKNIAAYTESGRVTRNVVSFISINREEDMRCTIHVRDRLGAEVTIDITPEGLESLACDIMAGIGGGS